MCATRSETFAGVAITLASGRKLVSTPEHMHFAGYVIGRTPQLHMTYLMWKDGVGFRVGTSLEGCDEAWVVGAHATRAEALARAAALADSYELPTAFLVEFDTEKAGYSLLADEDLSFDYPHHAAHGHTGRGFENAQKLAGLGWQVADRGGPVDLRGPPRQGLVHGPDLVQHGLVVRDVLEAGPVLTFVGDADLELVQRGEDVELRDCELGAPVEPHRVSEHHGVEPAGATAPPGVGPELGTAVDEEIPDGVALGQFSGERAAADAGHVGLHDADDSVDGAGSDPSAGADPTRDGVGGGDEGVGAVIEVEVGGLGALEEDVLAGVEGLVEEVHGVGDVWLEPGDEAEVSARDVIGVEGHP